MRHKILLCFNIHLYNHGCNTGGINVCHQVDIACCFIALDSVGGAVGSPQNHLILPTRKLPVLAEELSLILALADFKFPGEYDGRSRPMI